MPRHFDRAVSGSPDLEHILLYQGKLERVCQSYWSNLVYSNRLAFDLSCVVESVPKGSYFVLLDRETTSCAIRKEPKAIISLILLCVFFLELFLNFVSDTFALSLLDDDVWFVLLGATFAVFLLSAVISAIVHHFRRPKVESALDLPPDFLTLLLSWPAQIAAARKEQADRWAAPRFLLSLAGIGVPEGARGELFVKAAEAAVEILSDKDKERTEDSLKVRLTTEAAQFIATRYPDPLLNGVPIPRGGVLDQLGLRDFVANPLRRPPSRN
jgi:hypothetical protein